MPVISGSIPKLTDGVSQQAVTLRLNTAVEEQTNAWLSVVTGNQKRPPSRVIKKIGPVDTGNVATTIIDRFDGKKFIVVVKSGSIRVFDAYTGNEKTVATPNGTGYLTSALETDYEFVTVADTTFICNKTKVVQSSPVEEPPERLNPDIYWSIFVKEAIPNSNYAIYVNNVLDATFTTSTNVDADSALERTSYIANNLAVDLLTSGGVAGAVKALEAPVGWVGSPLNRLHDTKFYTATGGTGTGLKIKVVESNRKVAAWSVSKLGSGYTVGDVVTITGTYIGTVSFTVTEVVTGRAVSRANSTVSVRLNDTDTVALDDGQGGTSMTCFGPDIADFSKLPPQDAENRIVQVKGDAGSEGDDYWVIYKDNLWRETWGYGMRAHFDPATMPHVLVYDDLTDTFSFEEHTWPDRLVGDDDTNPHPAFLNQTITSMALHRGRLVILSGENVILSEADNYENFYRSSVIQLLDNEVIDVAAVTGRQANLFHSVPWNKKLLVFSDKSQFSLESAQVLSPKTASLTATSAYDCSKVIKPISMDTSVYFIEDSGPYAKLYEYLIGPDGLTEQADLTSIQVPEYIKGPVKRMVGIPKASSIFILGEDPKKLYVYKFMNGSQGKIQSAWNTWTFTREIKALNVSGNNLYVFVNGTDGLYLETIVVEDDAVRSANNLTVYLDDQIPLSATTRVYDSGPGITTITLPYAYDVSKVDFVNTSGDGMLGFHPQFNAPNSTTLTVAGDWTAINGVVGHRYDYSLTFSPFLLREAKQNATAAIQDGVLSIRYMSINYEDTAYFRVSVKNKGGVPSLYSGTDPVTQDYTGFVFGELESIIGTVPLASGEFRLPVFEDGRYVEIKIVNDSPFHSCFTSAEWYGQWTPKAKQRF